MVHINTINRGAIEIPKQPHRLSAMQETNFSSSSPNYKTETSCSKSVSFSSFAPNSSSKNHSEENQYVVKEISSEKQNNTNGDTNADFYSVEMLCSSLVANDRNNNLEDSKSTYLLNRPKFIIKIVNDMSDDSVNPSFISNNRHTLVPLSKAASKCKSGEESSSFLENCQSRIVHISKCNVSSASVQTDVLACQFSSSPIILSQDNQKYIAANANEAASHFILTPCKSMGKQDDEVSTRAVTPSENLLTGNIQTNGQKSSTINDVWNSFKGEQKAVESRYFLLRFAKTNQTLLLRDEDVIDQFEYFSGITEGNFCESKTQVIEMSEHLPYNIALLVFQSESKILNLLKKKSVCNVIEALDYLGFKYSDEFIQQLFRKIHRHRWTEEKRFASELVNCCAYTNIGMHLMSYLKRSPGIISSFLSKEGGQLIAEMCEKNADRTISLLNDICHNLCNCKIEMKDVAEFIIAATQQETLVDALADIWDPTLWYSTEKKSISKNAMSDGPHQVGEVDVELYADSDNQGSSTTVNICMSGGSPLDGTTPLSQVMNLGIYASTRGKATYIYTCFTARAKFKLKDYLLGEATFDLYPDGVKAFCPVISGGPHMHGLQLTCRIDDKVKEIKEDYRNRYNIEIGNQKIDDISVELKSRQFPFRGLTLYLLHNAILQNDSRFITLFASALQSDVCEWLATYLTPLCIQQSFPDHSYSYIAPSNLNSLPSPFAILQHWFADARIPIDTWCSKTVMGELLQSNHFQLLVSRHFFDCLQFIKYCKKWIDNESLLLFREKLVEFVSHKPHIVGALLFDFSCEALPSHTSHVSHKRQISDIILHDIKETEDTIETSKNRGTVSEGMSNVVNIATNSMRRFSNQIISTAPKKRYCPIEEVTSLSCNSEILGSKPLINCQDINGEKSEKNTDLEGAAVSIHISSSSACNTQIIGKHKKALQDVLKDLESMDWGPPDWFDNTKETIVGKGKRYRLY